MRFVGFVGACAAMVLGGCYVSSYDGVSSVGPSSYDPSSPPSTATATPSADGLTTGSRDVGAIEASLSAQSDGVTLTVYAALIDPTRGFLQISDGDYLTATVGGDTIVLTPEHEPQANQHHYTASFPAPATAADVDIAFVRRNGKVGAPHSTVRVEAPFTITSTPPTSVPYGGSLPISTSAGSDNTTIGVTGNCVTQAVPLPVSNGTEITLDLSQVEVTDNVPRCILAVSVRHESVGQSDSAFSYSSAYGSAGTTISGLQSRGFSIELVY